MGIKIPIKAMIYYAKPGRYGLSALANVMIGDYLSINSYSIVPNPKGGGTLVVFRPRVFLGDNNFKYIVEYVNRKKSKLESQIEKACRYAYEKYEDGGGLQQYSETYYIGIEDLINSEAINAQNPEESAKNTTSDDNYVVPF